MRQIESVDRIEPARLEELPQEVADKTADLSAKASTLGARLHPTTAADLAELIRIMNSYYSNLIEGNNTRPRDIERALSGHFDEDETRRNLQLESAAHVKVQRKIDQLALNGNLPEPASREFIQWLHRSFYEDAPEEMLRVRGAGREFIMQPGAWRSRPEHEVQVGRHLPPSSDRVDAFMEYFERRYRFEGMGTAARITAIAQAHHRLNYIHPFPDGNGRVSRLMSHAMAHHAGIGAHGLWSISRGLARGLESRKEYKEMMDLADSPRQGDLDGRGNLSQRAFVSFTSWFLRVCLDQVTFMSSLLDIDSLADRLHRAVERENLKPEAAHLLDEALMRGRVERGDAERITRLPERSARRVLNETIAAGLLESQTPKGPVSLRFPIALLETLFPRLYPEA